MPQQVKRTERDSEERVEDEWRLMAALSQVNENAGAACSLHQRSCASATANIHQIRQKKKSPSSSKPGLEDGGVTVQRAANTHSGLQQPLANTDTTILWLQLGKGD